MPTKKTTGRGYFGSTEKQASEVLKQIEATRKKQPSEKKPKPKKKKVITKPSAHKPIELTAYAKRKAKAAAAAKKKRRLTSKKK